MARTQTIKPTPTRASALEAGDYVWVSKSLWRVKEKQDLGSSLRLTLAYAEQGMWPGTNMNVIIVPPGQLLPKARGKSSSSENQAEDFESLWWKLGSSKDEVEAALNPKD
jgi:hypothetical protein